MYKSLKELALNITEEEYRNDGCLHYSTLATYERGGFNSISTLKERKESPSLTFGSCVDAIITGSMEEFNERFFVADFPEIPDAVKTIVDSCFREFSVTHASLYDIPDAEIIGRAIAYNYQNNWKPETRAKVIREKGDDYYKLKYIAGTKTIIDTRTYEQVLAAVRALKESPATKWYFESDNPFDDSIERIYQPKFRATFDGIEYSAMMDLIICDHKNKIIYPTDLKTSSHFEYEFYKSFLDWNYSLQAGAYAAILKANIEKDDYFKDFKIMDYRFIVVNKESLNPLVWEWNHTKDTKDIFIEKPNGYIMNIRNFRTIGKELHSYLVNNSKVPDGININNPNNIEEWLKK